MRTAREIAHEALATSRLCLVGVTEEEAKARGWAIHSDRCNVVTAAIEARDAEHRAAFRALVIECRPAITGDAFAGGQSSVVGRLLASLSPPPSPADEGATK